MLELLIECGIAEWVTNGDADKLANLTPGSKDAVDPVAYDEMRSFRKPFITIHEYSFYAPESKQ